MKLLILIPVLASLVIKNAMPMDCYWSNQCKYKYFSSKTSYESVRGDIRDSIVNDEGCQPISVWTIMRHGKKNPGAKFLRDIKEVLNFKDFITASYDDGNSSLCAQDVDNLRDWKIETSFIDEPNQIVNEGYLEMFNFGSRLREALPEIFANLHEEEYAFRPSLGPRAEVSTEALIQGLGYKDLLIEKAITNVTTGNPYGACRTYLKEVYSNPDTYKMSLQYMEIPEFVNMKERIEKRLGLSFPLTNKNIIAIYDLCRYTSDGIANEYSPWCAVFSEEDLEIIEYVGDLEHYYRSGYGASKYSNTFGQITLTDLFINLEKAKNKQGRKISVHLAHSSMMDMILVAFNVFKDANPLTAARRDLNRKWRSTFLSTFGVNLIAVLHRCRQSDDKLYDHKISFYWNERPFLELCNGGVCSWHEFEETFKPFLNATTDICELDK